MLRKQLLILIILLRQCLNCCCGRCGGTFACDFGVNLSRNCLWMFRFCLVRKMCLIFIKMHNCSNFPNFPDSLGGEGTFVAKSQVFVDNIVFWIFGCRVEWMWRVARVPRGWGKFGFGGDFQELSDRPNSDAELFRWLDAAKQCCHGCILWVEDRSLCVC